MNNKWRAFRHANDGKNDGKQLASIPFSMKQNWRAFRHANDGKNDGKKLASIPCSMNKNRGAFRHANDWKNDGTKIGEHSALQAVVKMLANKMSSIPSCSEASGG